MRAPQLPITLNAFIGEYRELFSTMKGHRPLFSEFPRSYFHLRGSLTLFCLGIFQKWNVTSLAQSAGEWEPSQRSRIRPSIHDESRNFQTRRYIQLHTYFYFIIWLLCNKPHPLHLVPRAQPANGMHENWVKLLSFIYGANNRRRYSFTYFIIKFELHFFFSHLS